MLLGGSTVAAAAYVDDEADILPQPTEARLAKAAATLERRTGHQFVVVTTRSLGGQPVERYSLALFDRLGVGRACCDDGVGLLVAPVERKARIEVGKGLEHALTDAEAARIMNRDILPRFRAGDLPGGVERGARAIIAEIDA
ncbi:TPM domain-containing protein [Sphingomonas sp. Leaf412]|uniref:TPM domain-containing protein n=1 Tax=Sphingomonas sp. Leaf412 TaxID=1736370 RepID=UPI001F2BB200|nr:TPM domain-containing protein [Sphingomonas sp. Leaf412]